MIMMMMMVVVTFTSKATLSKSPAGKQQASKQRRIATTFLHSCRPFTSITFLLCL